MPEITFLAFNYGNAGRYVNGPGMCLVNFVKLLRNAKYKVNIFTRLNNQGSQSLKDKDCIEAIKRSDVVHHWSGLNTDFIPLLKLAKKLNKPIISGPNIFDGLKLKEEERYLSEIESNKVLTVNPKLKLKIAKKHNLRLELIDILMNGPDPDEWAPSNIDNGKILWKGNSKQFVKDISFGLEVAKALPKYKFAFLGHPNPYNYLEHIKEAKKYHLYFTTSLSETMGLAVWEQSMAKIPCITHPAINFVQDNYRAGIVARRNVSAYCQAITEIMENSTLHSSLAKNAREYALDLYNSTLPQYKKIISEI